ncbi:MAG TPA: fused MFS/spermidine synthase [Thermoanaerobaculia bacterium]|nr:fused MFS/spermidine synthase [Thermoanaerobaculia bacterium]
MKPTESVAKSPFLAAVRAAVRPALFVTFAATGFSALTLQVVWQRVISLHAGLDLLAATTVVTAFLAGLGLGSLAGGAVADRLGPRRSLLAFALSNAAIGAFAWSSLWLFYDVYRQFAAALDSAAAMFAFHFLLLVVPTTLMGLSLPLLARGAVAASREIAPLVGRLYAVNTLGAAAGAVVAGWWLLGQFGFVASVRIAGTLNLAAAAVVLLLRRFAAPAGPERGEPAADTAGAAAGPAGRAERSWPWFLLYGLTGAVAIGLEVVYFRVVDAIWRNNSYTFATVLAIYLLLFGLGASLGARRAGRVERPDLWFLWLQFWVGASSLLGMLVLLHPPHALGIADFVTHYYKTLGFMPGDYAIRSAADAGRLLYAHVVAPLLVMGAPVLFMGASFPFIQALVARRLDSLGRRTGTLLCSNICGNVVGGAVTGFVLLDRLGSAGALQLLSGVLLLPGLAAAARLSTPRRRLAGAVGAAGLMIACIAAFPSNQDFWAFFHSASPEQRFELEEDRTCVTSLVDIEDETFLYINGSWQNGHPYDLFHIVIGLVPSLLHENPERGLAIGLGIGSTAYSMAQDPRLDHIDCVEICGGQKRLIAALAERGSSASRRLLADPRVELHTGDGRRWLLGRPEPYDVIVVDVVRPNTAYSGNLYSVEFYELVASRLAPDGLFVQWVPSDRVLNSVRRVFPHVATAIVPEYFQSRFLIAGKRPLFLHRPNLQERFASVDQAAFDPEQRQQLVDFFGGVRFRRQRYPKTVDWLADVHFNRDLHPRDEYFLNDHWARAGEPPQNSKAREEKGKGRRRGSPPS